MDLKFKDNSKLKLAPFTQLEYIESTGTQWIDTGISAPNGFKIEIEYQYTEIESNYRILVGSINASNPYCRNMIGKDNQGRFFIGNKTGYWGISGVSTNKTKLIASTVDASTIIIDDSTVTMQRIATYSDTTQSTYNLYVFGNNSANSFSQSVKIKLFYLKIYDYQDNIVREFIPAKDRNDVVCLYDKVSGTFFYNQGTGNFVAGPEGNIGIPETILLKTTTLYHKNTPNVDGLQLLNGILNAQETAEDIVLNRIRVDIGNVSGSLSELLQYASMAGFNDNYEPQVKPRLIGTWTINNWYTTTQLAQAQSAFDGLTLIGDPNYILDFSQMAVQVLDPNEDNYNPAVAIILQGQNLGTTMTSSPLGHGRWFLTKTQAAAINNINEWFRGKTSVTDVNSIVSSNNSTSYNFDDFTQFNMFNITTLGNYAFLNCSLLEYITLPTSITTIGSGSFKGCSKLRCDINLPNLVSFSTNAYGGCEAFTGTKIEHILSLGSITSLPGAKGVNGSIFKGCTELLSVNLPQTLLQIGHRTFFGCSKLESVYCDANLTYIGNDAFSGCVELVDFTIPSTLVTIGYNAFYNCNKFTGIINLPNLTTFLTGAYNNTAPFNGTKITQVTSLGAVTALPGGNGAGVFTGCTTITSIVIPSTVTSIGQAAFRNCNSLMSLTILATTPPTIATDWTVFNNVPANCIIYVPSASVADYQSAAGWSDRAAYIQAIPSN